MADREKVIYSIERCICHVPDACRDCGYDNEPCPKCFEHLLRDAHDLLKEQEPVMWSHDGYNCFECSNCGLCIEDEVYYMMNKPISFCPVCGRRVKWE